MKKILFVAAVAASVLAACDGGAGKTQDAVSERDSLQSIIDQKDNEINDLMGTFNEVQAGFELINEAEGRINMMKNNVENNSTADNIRENMEFIRQTMAENRQKIEDLENKLRSSSINSAKLKETITKLTQQLTAKNEEIEQLNAQLAEKDIIIEELGSTVNSLKDENAQVKQQKENSDEIVRAQDSQINTAWYAIGTSKELKEQNILKKGEVLQGSYNTSYFTKVDIRKVNVIPLESKSAELLTTHPDGSYSLLKDGSGKYTLRITDANRFWSISKYLVIKVK